MYWRQMRLIEDEPREPPDFSEIFLFSPEQRTAKAAAKRKKVAPHPLHSCYVADLNGYRVTQDMLRHPSGPRFCDLIGVGTVVRTSYGTGPYIVKDIREFVDYGVETYSLVCSDVDKSGRYFLNELVAVDGRMLALFVANDDEVFVDEDFFLEQPTLSFERR